MKNRYDRQAYISILEHYRDTEQIKVLTGVRRCGKSTLLDLFREKLKESGVPEQNIIRRRFDQFEMAGIRTAEGLQADLARALAKAQKGMVYVMLDEVQLVDGWETVVRGLHTRPDTDIYITGSNAYLLSSDLATYLAGRYVEIKVYPLSFREYSLFFRLSHPQMQESEEKLFAQYLRYGGMPSLFALKSMDEQDIRRELSAIFDSVVVSDVAQRFKIRDFPLLLRLVSYVFATSGNLFSTQKIVNTLKSMGHRTTIQTIDGYLFALEEALILHGVSQTGLQGKSILRPLRKFYPVDTGLRNLSIGFAVKDIGAQLENVVCIELLRREFIVTVGDTSKGEVDFVAKRGDETTYIQVCDRLDERVMERELASLRHIHDAFPKLVLTSDRLHTGITEDGIKVVNTIDWLLAEA